MAYLRELLYPNKQRCALLAFKSKDKDAMKDPDHC